MPTKSRVTINVMTLNENADKRAHMNPPPIEINNTRLRPVVSAKKPHKCELITIPMYPTEFKNPCSIVDMLISHRTYGRTKPIFTFSTTTAIKPNPHTNNRYRWNLP